MRTFTICLEKNPGVGSFLTGICKFILNYFYIGVVPTNALALGGATLLLVFLGVSNNCESSSTATDHFLIFLQIIFQ